MDYLILAAIGIVMGLFGGLLGIGGSIIMIPALVFVYGENQHLYQASAMICNFFVVAGAVIVHKKANVLVPEVLRWMVPAAGAGIIIGVTISNSSVFASENSYILARVYGLFMACFVVYNFLRFGGKHRSGADGVDISRIRRSIPLNVLCGLLTGIPAGLLGIGGGVICVPAQQFFLRMPLKRAISNSAATIAVIAVIGAFYKNMTLAQQGIRVAESLTIAAFTIPGAMMGAFLGGHGTHKLHTDIVRGAFVLLAAVACYKMLTVSPPV